MEVSSQNVIKLTFAKVCTQIASIVIDVSCHLCQSSVQYKRTKIRTSLPYPSHFNADPQTLNCVSNIRPSWYSYSDKLSKMEGKLNVTFMLLISHAFLLAFAAGAMDQSGVEWRQVQGLPSQQIKLGKAENIAKADSAGKLGPSEDILVVKLNWAVSRLDTAMTIDEMQLYSELSLEIAQNLKVVKDIAMDLANLKQAINIAKLDFAEKLGPSEDILVVKLNWAVSRLDAAGTVDQMHLYNKLSLQIGQTLKIVKELGLDL